MHLPIELKRTTDGELSALYRDHMTRDFPPSELKPLEMFRQLIRDGLAAVYLCLSDQQLVGYAALAAEPGGQAVLLDYLAVVPEQRGTGCGTAILQALQTMLKRPILIESEHPEAAQTPEDRQIRTRRIHFYQQAGCRLTGRRVLLFGVDFDLLCLGGPLSPEEAVAAYASLYQKMLPRERYQKKVILL